MPPRKLPGEYPAPLDNETITKSVIRIATTQSFLIVTYESQRTITIYVGGHDKWCINCELIKRDNKIQPLGYLTKLRYDLFCSLEHSFLKGKDTKELVFFLVQYINDKYPTVKELMFNDLSTRRCDNDEEVNLAVMTYLYSEQTWYEKNFGAYVGTQSEQEWNRIKDVYKKTYKQKNNDEFKNKVAWDEMRETIRNNEAITKMTDRDLEELYNKTETWKGFFEPIYDKIKIDKFCIWISSWIDRFIKKYFNNLYGLSYILPIKDYKIKYTENKYNRGGRSYTRKSTRKQDKDYK